MTDKELVEAVRFLKTTCENQIEINKILKDEIVQLIKESEMHKQFIRELFEHVTTMVITALPDISADVWNKLVEKTKSLGVFDKLYDDIERNKWAVVEKHFQYKGHDCICVFTRNGYRCGYVSTTLRRDYDSFDIECHCELTFSGALPEVYEPKESFYIGFDCGHCCDGLDTQLALDYGLISQATKKMLDESFSYLRGNPVRDISYVEEQCKKIVDQLEELEKQ